MRLSHVPQRGMALVMAMIVIVLITLLVAGAITFTGTERASAMIQSDEDAMSACTQAARNLFLARLRVLLGNAERIQFNDVINNEGRTIATGHFDSVNVVSARVVKPNTVGEARSSVNSIENRDGTAALVANYYLVTAVCLERAPDPDPAKPRPPQREVEFVVRVGL